jgi:hypothetical protein
LFDRRARGLGLERLQRAQRAPQLGHGRAAIAQHGVERARAVAIAHQGHAEPVVALLEIALDAERLGLDPVGALEPPGGDQQAPGEQALHPALGCDVAEQQRRQGLELLGALVVEQGGAAGAQAVPERVPGDPRLAGGG